MKKVGITGGIGSGKSFIARIIQSFGYPIFNSDAVAKQIIGTNAFVKEELISLFGQEVYVNNELNKSFLAKIIFNDNHALEQVNQLVHPLVRESFTHFAEQQQSDLVFNEAAILFESGGEKQFDKIILVTAPKELRIKRVMERDAVSESQVIARMNKQWSDEEKQKRSDYIILNDQKQPLLIQIENVLKELK